LPSANIEACKRSRDIVWTNKKAYVMSRGFHCRHLSIGSHDVSTNGRESTVNRALDRSIYPGSNLAPFSLKIIGLDVKTHNKVYSRLVTPSGGQYSPIVELAYGHVTMF
jgi:hypothetical protein